VSELKRVPDENREERVICVPTSEQEVTKNVPVLLI